MKNTICLAVIVAGGKGLRLDPEHPKQYLPLAGKPILVHTLERFRDSGCFEHITVVLPAPDVAFWPALCAKYRLDETFFEAVAGGATRFDSVHAGLNALDRRYATRKNSADCWVAVHDGVRPLVSPSFLKACLQAAFKHGNAVPALPPIESFRYLDTDIAENPEDANPGTPTAPNRPIDRNRLRSLQTPQCARLTRLSEAFHRAAGHPESEKTRLFTDEATVLEYAGDRIHLCEGSPFNLKITRPIDLKWAELVLASEWI